MWISMRLWAKTITCHYFSNIGEKNPTSTLSFLWLSANCSSIYSIHWKNCIELLRKLQDNLPEIMYWILCLLRGFWLVLHTLALAHSASWGLNCLGRRGGGCCGGKPPPSMVSFTCLGKRWCPKYFLLCIDSPFKVSASHTLGNCSSPPHGLGNLFSSHWDANQFHPGHSDWLRDGPMSKVEPINQGLHLDSYMTIRKRSPSSTRIGKSGGCESKALCGYLVNHAKRIGVVIKPRRGK